VAASGAPEEDYMVPQESFPMAPLQLYNSLSRRIERFRPARSAVTIYICGITPYATTHLGHAFTYAMADTLIRFLEHQGCRVCYVQNLTDVDDAILREARRVGEDYRALGDRWTTHFIREMQTLNIRPPDHFPRATDAIPEIIETVRKLCNAGVAYAAGGSVYFDTERWPSYGKLSRLPRPEMLPIANERGNNPDDPHKHRPMDFVLWQAQTPGEPAWESPWGPGRPGWHIECSTLVQQFLGETIDIHGGGTDLIFPHHDSEIAQSECATGQEPFARWWFHTAMVQLAGRKISKSLGNLIMVQDLLAKYTSDAIRLYLAGHHYRHIWQYDPAGLEAAERLASRLRAAVTWPVRPRSSLPFDLRSKPQAFMQALADDLDTPTAVQILTSFAEEILHAARTGQAVQAAQKTLRSMGHIFGLHLGDEAPESAVLAGWNWHLQRTLRKASDA
jgi:L-cysteine:1D-myo-inositol 2-amino-2-deoxy-alpha-D-glucopyranoside ligase